MNNSAFRILLAVVGIVATMLVFSVLLLGFGLLPDLPSLPPICLQAGWVCRMDGEADAAVSTASATWWLVPTTAAGAVATVAAVVMALRQDRIRSKSEDRERTRINRAAKSAILKAYDFCKTAETAVAAMNRPLEDSGWQPLGAQGWALHGELGSGPIDVSVTI